jgi:mannose-6-phosphate isomerase
MGTHPNGPSIVSESGISLKDYIEKHPQVLGEKSRQLFGDDLPYLLKVLSVNQALSIQAHPNKGHAEILFRDHPDVYKDPNHKPEMAIALSDFEALCGFRPLEEIKHFLRSIPELASVIGENDTKALLDSNEANYHSALKGAFTSLMKASKDALAKELASLKAANLAKSTRDDVDELFLRLLQQYPGDVGCFVIFFTNRIVLRPGEALFLGPNLIHAYLSGDCIECMACSDNVVRAGLTPKLIDVPTLCEMLIYACGAPEAMKFAPVKESDNCLLYNPQVPDFAVAKIGVFPSDGDVLLPKRASASIMIVTSGTGFINVSGLGQDRALKRGQVVFIAADQDVIVKGTGNEELQLYQAFC